MHVISEPAGWYPDPAGGHEWRFWDGRAWSDTVADAGTTSVDPPGAPVASEPDRRIALPAAVAWGGVAVFVLALAISVGVVAAARTLGAGRALQLMLSGVVLYGGLVAYVMAVSHHSGTGHVRRDFALSFEGFDVVRGLLGALVGRAVVAFVLVVALLIGVHLPSNVPSTRGDVALVLAYSLLAITVAPVVEELFFRGVIQRALVGRLGVAGAVVAQALVFGAAHLKPVYGGAGVWLGLSLALSAVVLGWLAATYRRLGPSVAAHALFNLVAVIALLSQL